MSILDIIADVAITEVRSAFDSYFAGRDRVESFLDRFGLLDPDRYDAFEVVGEEVPQETIEVSDFADSDYDVIRDALITSRHGYLDQSELQDEGLVDADGYVTDLDGIYDFVSRDSFLPFQDEAWLDSEVTYARESFELLRVVEEKGFSPNGGLYEANVSLMRDLDTGEYVISIGGTSSLSDVNTDIVGLFLAGNTLEHGEAVNRIVADMFANDIPAGANVDISGHSLGAAAALELYDSNPGAFDEVFVVQAVGLGGADGTYYDQYRADGVGDESIIEIFGDDPGEDFNDVVTYWGHVGSGTVYDLGDNVVNADNGPSNEFLDSHLLDNLWATVDSFDFAIA
ncbi:hypothetical protein [Pseudaestuariivita rosea]|uniref:hypothetical protein n=1 Tax=Pseudaestuariivita rosea TaxID=2763263 RepID=UPI001ABBA43D|nr:hypothetical protein [Pseudaestuariivita rosea]